MTAEHSFYETPLPREQFEEHLGAALAELEGPEGQELSEYVDWFLRRYPTPLERLAYARRKYDEAMRTQGLARR
jgi:hypothetical protein